MSVTETKTTTDSGVIVVPELATRYRLAESQLALLPPADEDDAEEWLGLRLQCEEVMMLIARIAALTLERDTLKAERDTLLRALTHEDAAVIHRVTSKVLAARASTPPTHPINDDEQRRKDAGWNDRPKARCVCGEMIAWYSGEYLHVDSRSKSCADGRLASPAHFLVGMPPAEPEWKKEA